MSSEVQRDAADVEARGLNGVANEAALARSCSRRDVKGPRAQRTTKHLLAESRAKREKSNQHLRALFSSMGSQTNADETFHSSHEAFALRRGGTGEKKRVEYCALEYSPVRAST